MKYVLGIDLGTSYFKVIIVDEIGRGVGFARIRTPKTTNGKLVTMSAAVFLQAVKSSIAEAVEKANIDSHDIVGISYGSQSNTFLLLDRHGQPLTDFYIWSTEFDATVDPSLVELWQQPGFLEETGIGGWCTPGSTINKLLWMKNNRKDMWCKIAKVATLPDYLMLFLTGTLYADESSDSLLGLLSVKQQKWLPASLDAIGMRAEQFGTVVRGGEFVGHLTDKAAAFLHLKADTKVFSGGLDHIVASIGAGLGYHAPLSESTGTVIAAVAIRDDYSPRRNVALSPFPQTDAYAYLSFYGMGSETVERYKEAYFPDESIDDMLSRSATIPVGSNGVNYYDYEDSDLPLEKRFTNTTGNKDDEIRAILEGICYRTYLMCESATGVTQLDSILSTGGLNRSVDLLQLRANLLGSNVITCVQKELGAYGAAILAAVGCSWYNHFNEAQKAWIEIEHVYHPDKDTHAAYLDWIASRKKRYR